MKKSKKAKKAKTPKKTIKPTKAKKPVKSVEPQFIPPVLPQIDAKHIFSMLDDKDIMAVLIDRLENKMAETQSCLGIYEWMKIIPKSENKIRKRHLANEKKIKKIVKSLKSASKLNLKLVNAYE